MKRKQIFLASVLMVIIAFSFSSTLAFAHPHPGESKINSHTHKPQTEYIPIDGIIGIEKTTVLFHASATNKLPWGFVEGKISNHVEGYPVIIQIFKDGQAVHFAQTDVKEDGSYEYKFRVLNVNDGKTSRLFVGDYYATIFKVVYLNQNNMI
jgi:hypothetical protein